MIHKKSRRKKAARVWHEYCVPCAKVAYPNMSIADSERKNFVRSNKSDRDVGIYRCPEGGSWHIASSKPRGR